MLGPKIWGFYLKQLEAGIYAVEGVTEHREWWSQGNESEQNIEIRFLDWKRKWRIPWGRSIFSGARKLSRPHLQAILWEHECRGAVGGHGLLGKVLQRQRKWFSCGYRGDTKMRLLECRGSTPLLVQAAVWSPGSLQQHLLACFCSWKSCFLHDNE